MGGNELEVKYIDEMFQEIGCEGGDPTLPDGHVHTNPVVQGTPSDGL